MRVTIKHLQGLVDSINQATGNKLEVYGPEGANIGTYHLDGAYGGYKLVQTMNRGGGIREITYGFLPKSQVYDLDSAYLRGLQTKGDK